MVELLGAVGLCAVLLACVTRDLLRIHGIVLRELESLDPSADEEREPAAVSLAEHRCADCMDDPLHRLSA